MLHRWRSPVAAALVLALAWTAGEVARGILFGGFPWNLIGYAFAQSTALSQLAALTGIHGLSLLAVALGALPVVWLEPEARARWQPLAAGGLILVAIWAGGALRLADAWPSRSPPCTCAWFRATSRSRTNGSPKDAPVPSSAISRCRRRTRVP